MTSNRPHLMLPGGQRHEPEPSVMQQLQEIEAMIGSLNENSQAHARAASQCAVHAVLYADKATAALGEEDAELDPRNIATAALYASLSQSYGGASVAAASAREIARSTIDQLASRHFQIKQNINPATPTGDN